MICTHLEELLSDIQEKLKTNLQIHYACLLDNNTREFYFDYQNPKIEPGFKSPAEEMFVYNTDTEWFGTLSELVQKLKTPCIVWLMLPAKEVTDQMIEKLSELLSPNDIVIDGGNNFYKAAAKHQ